MLTISVPDASGASPEPQFKSGENAALSKPEMEKLRKKITFSDLLGFMKSEGFDDLSTAINYDEFKTEFPSLVKIKEENAAFSVFKVNDGEYLVVLTAGYYRVGQGRLLHRSRDIYNQARGRLVEHIRKGNGGETRYSFSSRTGAYASGSFKEVKPAFLINKSGELKVTKHVYFNHVLDSNEKKSFEKEVAITSRYIESKGHVGIVRHVAGDSFDHKSKGTLRTLHKVIGVQPYLGDSLLDYMGKKRGEFDVHFLMNLFKKVVKELKSLDGHVHGDLKPANMTFKQGSGGESEVGLIDFGFAEEVGKEFNRVTNPWDTCQYFDPFRLSGYCAASDVFTLAFVMLAYQSSSFNKEAEKFLTYICLKLDATMSLKDISGLLVSYDESKLLVKSALNSIKYYRSNAFNSKYKEAFKFFSIEDFIFKKHYLFNYLTKDLSEGDKTDEVKEIKAKEIKALEGDNLKIVASLYGEGNFNSSVLGLISRLKDDNLKIASSLCEKGNFNSSVLGLISRLKGDNLKIASSLCEKGNFNSSVLGDISRLEGDNLKIAASLYEKDGFNSSVLGDIARLRGDNLKVAASLYKEVDFNLSVLGDISRLKDDNLKIAVSLYKKDDLNSSVLDNISRLKDVNLKIAVSLYERG